MELFSIFCLHPFTSWFKPTLASCLLVQVSTSFDDSKLPNASNFSAEEFGLISASAFKADLSPTGFPSASLCSLLSILFSTASPIASVSDENTNSPWSSSPSSSNGGGPSAKTVDKFEPNIEEWSTL